MLRLMHDEYIVKSREHRKLGFRRILSGASLAFRYPVVLVRGSVIGALIGMMPGVGAAIANLLSYNATKRGDADPSRFGAGAPKGVVAAESANSSSEGGAMLTLIALGIPGGAATAMLYSVFAVNNVTGGPAFYAENKEIVYAIVLNNLVQTVLLFVVGLGCIHIFASLVRVPNRFLVPSVLATAVIATYAVTGNMTGPVTAIVFGILGWLMRRHGYPLSAMVVGLLLGRQLEQEALRSVQISGGQLSYIFERPITLILASLFVFSILWPSRRLLLRFFRGRAR